MSVPFSSHRKPVFILTTLAAIFSFLASQPSGAQQSSAQSQNTISTARPLITQTIDESQLTVLKGNTHPLARPQFDLGTASPTLPMQRMLLVLKRSPDEESALRKLLDNQQDKSSPSYHQWLTPEEFGKQFGPTDTDLQTITSWLQSHGFQVGSTKGRSALEFSGSAGQVQEAFHTTIHKYLVNSEQHWANASDPWIPSALTPAVTGVLTLHNFLKKPHYVRHDQKFSFTQVAGKPPEFTSSPGLYALVPADYAVIYNINPVYQAGINGNGITIAVIGRSDISTQDVLDFRAHVGIPIEPPTVILNGPDPGDVPGDDFEGTLDTIWSGAVAPGATIDFVTSATTNTTDGVDLSLYYIVENNLGNIMTESFGGCEAGTTQADADGLSAIAEQAAAQGISYMNSSGDAGAEGCDSPNFETIATGPISADLPAAVPFVTAVGGTLFNESGNDSTYWSTANNATTLSSALSYIPENVWNESCTSATCGGNANIAAGGGGASIFFSKPAWQSALTGSGDGMRDVPDVSLTAASHDPYLICFQGSCEQGFFYAVAGTSASAPSFAGIMALVDQRMGQVLGTPAGARQGLANYVLYNLAKQQSFSLCNASIGQPNSACVFNDVTVGNNEVPGELNYPNAPYNAGVGYDLATGLGSVNVNNLVNGWAAATFQPTTTSLILNPQTGITHGQSAHVSIAVAPNSGTVMPTGDVSLVAMLGSSPSGQTSVEGFTLINGATPPNSTTLHLPGGNNYLVFAHYAGDGTFAPSDSPTVQVTVMPESSTTAMSGPFTQDQNGLFVVPFTSGPYGSPVFMRADVQGAVPSTTIQGLPTGPVTFTDTFGTIPATSNTVLNSLGNSSVRTAYFDAGSHSISAAYAGDLSFNPSGSLQNPNPALRSTTFTIAPGFFPAFLSPAAQTVLVTEPGSTGVGQVFVYASTGFSGTIDLSCSGLPSEAACAFTPSSIVANGIHNETNCIFKVTTKAATAMLQPGPRPYFRGQWIAGASLFFAVALMGIPKQRRSCSLFLLIMLAVILLAPGCGGGGGSNGPPPPPPDPGTPAGTYNVAVQATSGSTVSTANFTLVVQ